MRRIGWAALMIALVAASPALARKRDKAQAPAAPVADDGWRTYTYPKLGFSVELPREPQIHEGMAETVDGTKKTTSYTVDDGEAGAAMINVTEYGGSGKDPSALLDLAAKDAVGTLKGLLISETRIQLGGAPGVDVMMTIPNGGAVDRIIWANGRLYQVLLAGPQTTGAASNYRTTTSFTILKP